MTLTTQFVTMLAMIAMGIFFGAMFDTYNRLFNRSNKHSIVVFLNDILFWLLQCLITFFILYKINNGEIRFYIFLALLCGFAAYQSLIKSLYMQLLEIVISAVISLYGGIVSLVKAIIVKPIYTIIIIVSSFIIIISKGIFTIIMYILKVIFKIIKLVLSIIFYPLKVIVRPVYNKYIRMTITKFSKTVYNKTYNVKNILKKLFKR